MKEYTSKVELTSAIKASYKKYIGEFVNISEDFKDKRFEEVDRTPTENLAYQSWLDNFTLKNGQIVQPKLLFGKFVNLFI